MISIKVLYGPYEAHGVINHKIQKIYGILAYLKQHDYEFEVLPSPHLNRLTIEMNERVIYTCDIRYMKFNLPSKDDIHCRRIIDAINLHQLTFAQETNVPHFAPKSEGMRWQREQGFEGSYMDTTQDTFDYFGVSGISREGFQIGGEDGDEEWEMSVMDALRNWDTDAFMRQYVIDYGCLMQEPVESDETETPEAETTEITESSTSTSCVCLSIDPPSLYSICQNPPTPLNTEVSQKYVDDDLEITVNTDLNEEAREMFELPEWKDILPRSLVPLEESGESDLEDTVNVDKTLSDEFYTFEDDTDLSMLGFLKKAKSQKKQSSGAYKVKIVKYEDQADSSSFYDKSGDSSRSWDQAIDNLKMEIQSLSASVEKVPELPIRCKVCPTFTGGRCKRNDVYRTSAQEFWRKEEK